MTTLRREFINRIDELVTFNDLDEAVIGRIVDLQLGQLVEKLAQQDIHLTVSDEVRSYLVRNGYDPQYGARPFRWNLHLSVLGPEPSGGSFPPQVAFH